MAAPGTKGPLNIYRLIFFSTSIIFIDRSRATTPPSLLIGSNCLHVPLPSLAVSAGGLACASPVRAWCLDPDPSPSSSPSPRSDLDQPCPHCRHRSSSSPSLALSLAPRTRMPCRALVVPFTRALVVVPVTARSRGLLRHVLRRSSAALFLATLVALPFAVLYRAAVWGSLGASWGWDSLPSFAASRRRAPKATIW